MQQKLLIAILIWAANTTLQAQFSDNFSDGNFTSNLVWEGEPTEFIINAAGELQLNAPDAGNSILMTKAKFPYAAVWEFKTRLEFAPTTANLLRIWLVANSLSNDSDGYYLEIGETGSTDALRLYRRQNNVATLIGTGIAGEVATDPTDIRVQISRTATGNWTAMMGTNGGALTPQFTTNDNALAIDGNKWFGFYCLYTATRKDKFFFDDITVKADSSDTEPPVYVSTQVIDNKTVALQFNEPLDSISAVTLANYMLGIGIAPAAATWSSSQADRVVLTFANSFVNGATNTLQCTNLRDWLGNTAATQQQEFLFLLEESAAEFDIVINEIMHNPSPGQGLPESAEWVEILNRSNKYIRLSQLSIADASSTPKPLPDYLLKPDSVLVLCSSSAAALLTPFTANVRSITSFPTLNDDLDKVILTNQQGLEIDKITYFDSWHTDVTKRDGGWSLERINPDLVCLGSQNWQSCPQLPGGSPGKKNFAYSTAPDEIAPTPFEVNVVNANVLLVTFSEGMEMSALSSPNNYIFTPDLDIANITPVGDNRAKATITLSTPMQLKTVYELTFSPNLTDCSGNSLSPDSKFVFGVPEKPAAGDILVNELLFNPSTGGSRFVELYNKSDKIFYWNGFYLANYAKSTTGVKIINDRLFLPGDYYVFTTDRTNIIERFQDVREGRVFTQLLPSLDDSDGNITLYWSDGASSITMDSFNYSVDLHNKLLSIGDREGVSIERIRFDAPTNNTNNWTSAANNGTPTQPNSQQSAVQPNSDDLITLSSSHVSPDGDGVEDYLDILFNLQKPGYSATATIYDAEGIPVKKILKQELAGVQGALRWDGDADDGSKIRPGIYILFMEIFSADGKVSRIKKPFSVVFSRD